MIVCSAAVPLKAIREQCCITGKAALVTARLQTPRPQAEFVKDDYLGSTFPRGCSVKVNIWNNRGHNEVTSAASCPRAAK